MQFEKGGWSSFDSYGLSKLCVIMMSRGLFLNGIIPATTTTINMDPGTVNTKMLLAGWGACGINVEDASDTFNLATDPKFERPGEKATYYVGMHETNPTPQACNDEACAAFASYLTNM